MDLNDPGDEYDDYGTLLSPIISSTDPSGYCVSFWYHMYGDDVNKLSAYYEVRGTPQETLWSRTGSQGPYWKYGQVSELLYGFSATHKQTVRFAMLKRNTVQEELVDLSL